MEDRYWWAPAVGGGILLVLFGCLALVAAGGWKWFADFLTGQASGWAQAIGAIVAMAAAYRVGRAQIVSDRILEAERRTRDELRRVGIIDALLSNAEGLCTAYGDSWDRRDGVPVAGPIADYLGDCRASIAAVNPFDSPDATVVIYLAQLPRQIDHLIEAHRDFDDAFTKAPGHKDFHEAFRHLRTRLDDAKEMIKDAREACASASTAIEAEHRREVGSQALPSQ